MREAESGRAPWLAEACNDRLNITDNPAAQKAEDVSPLNVFINCSSGLVPPSSPPNPPSAAPSDRRLPHGGPEGSRRGRSHSIPEKAMDTYQRSANGAGILE